MRRILCAICVAVVTALAGARTVADYFVAAPAGSEALPYLDSLTRLDMLDYYRSGLESRTRNLLGDSTAITALSERVMTVHAGRGVDLQLGMATAGSDTLLIVVETLATPLSDSKVRLYTTDWQPYSRQPEVEVPYDEWLNDHGRRNLQRVHELLPFISYSAEVSEDQGMLILRHSMADYFVADDPDGREALGYLRPDMAYMIKNRRYELR